VKDRVITTGSFAAAIGLALVLVLLTPAVLSRAGGGTPSDRGGVLLALTNYRAAMTARDLKALARTVTSDLMVAEGTSVNLGWADYRDHHIGPEMREWRYFSVEGVKTEVLEISGDQAFVVQKSTVTLGEKDGPVPLESVETFVLRRSDGSWKIRHVHFSGKRIQNGAIP
jgi:ketosteroid isomerase-like protein